MNTNQLIKSLVEKGESEQLEFKAVVFKENIGKTVCSLLNTNGGHILIGVREKDITGVKNAEKHRSELENFLVSVIAPNAPISISIENYKDLKVLLIKVWRGSRFPYTFKSSIYYRNNTNTVKASPDQISELIEKRQKTETLWERQDALEVELDDLDEIVIRETLKDIQKSGRGKSFTEKEVSEFLTYYGLYQNGNLTNAAVILFAKEPARYLPQSRIRLIVYKNDKAGDEYHYDKVFEGNLFRNVEEITQFFDVNIGISSQFKETNWKRIDKSFPRLALREGLLNALIHRDYSNVSGGVTLEFYPDRFEINNFGALPSEIKLADLKKNHLSFPRNPDIAHISFLRAWIDKIGRGTLKIIGDCKEKGVPAPKWKSSKKMTKLVFPKITVTGKYDTGSKMETNGINDGADKGAIEGAIEGATERKKANLKILLNAIHKNEGKRVPEYEKITKFPTSSLERYIKQLKDAELIYFSNEASQIGGYYLTGKINKKIKSSKKHKQYDK
jgi:ATP-dependent DNA helicase RecG